MSRSIKKNPYVKGGGRGSKRSASKVVRRHKGFIPDGKQYRKLYCSWNIHDWRSYSPQPEFLRK